MADLTDFAASLKALRDAYAEQLPDRIDQLDLAWRQWSAGVWDEPGFEALHRMVHALSGSGKIFGYAQLSEEAHTLEDTLRELALAKVVPDASGRQVVLDLLNRLRMASQAHRRESRTG